ncbi:HNH endonuclease [Photobacterium leiognathi]|uniref:HNH endonuclease n=1 Tax=Photobacterium leiognathi TaxID=553611 RepID=UPI0027357FC1|nr:hypothetical protein [Photobacterium leiognathi]
MEVVDKIIYHHLTDAEFFNINKPKDTEKKGGGQTYIDCPIKTITVDNWDSFFDSIKDVDKKRVAKGRPCWEFPIFSIGLDTPLTDSPQRVKVYQRRATSVCISSQKLDSSKSNRVRAWHPDVGFPYPVDNTQRDLCPNGLMVYLVATKSGQIWAGWYLNDGTTPLPFSGTLLPELNEMFETNYEQEGYSGLITLPEKSLFIDFSAPSTPLKTDNHPTVPVVSNPPTATNDDHDFDSAFLEDSSPDADVVTVEKLVQVKKRNRALVSKLKKLYDHKCQITGDEFLFQKKDGTYYTEAHHLIPLGKGGSDKVENLIVISPQVHSMLHHAADVSGLDLDKITVDKDGYGHLAFTINGKGYTITWHPSHTVTL